MKILSQYRGISVGFLIALSCGILIELHTIVWLFVGLFSCVLGVYAVKALHHHIHKTLGDSVVDFVPLATILFANILHPMIDGLSWFEVYSREGVFAAVLVGASIVLHEVLRQSALINATKKYVGWSVIVLTAAVGTMFGIIFGIKNAVFFHEYEIWADIATLFAYGFVFGDFFSHAPSKKQYGVLFLGILIGITFLFVAA